MRSFTFVGIAAALLVLAISTPTSADLVIQGVVDGDLSGGNPKAVIFRAESDIADLSVFGFGSANNGDGTDGEEFTFSGSLAAGQLLVVTANADSDAFFQWFAPDFVQVNAGSPANINGDDAIELFQNGALLDTYGDINVDGTGETWEYRDGFAVRTGGTAGAFDQANYNTAFLGLNNLSDVEQKAVIGDAFGFSPVPEPTSFLVLTVLGLAATRRRR